MIVEDPVVQTIVWEFFRQYDNPGELVRLYNTVLDYSFDEKSKIYFVSNDILGAGKQGEHLRFYVIYEYNQFRIKFKCKKEKLPFSVKELLIYKKVVKENEAFFSEHIGELVSTRELKQLNDEVALEIRKKRTKKLWYDELELRKNTKYEIDVHYIHPYYKKELGYFVESERILDLKRQDRDAMNYYYKALSKIIPQDSYVCNVPPSRKNDVSGLMRILLEMDRRGKIQYCECLRRKEDREKKAYGGSRNIETDLATISFVDKYNVKKKNIILVDDVCTTGASLAACKKILLDNKVKSVDCFVLAQTVWELDK